MQVLSAWELSAAGWLQICARQLSNVGLESHAASGAEFPSSAAEVAESAKFRSLFPTVQPWIETLEAMAPALGSEHIILNHATIAPKETLEAARLVAARNANYLDAPFTGSRDAAEAGQIVFSSAGRSVCWRGFAFTLRSMPRPSSR